MKPFLEATMTVKLCTVKRLRTPLAAIGLFMASFTAFADIVVISNSVPNVLSINDLKDIMIRESVRAHGYCACPYSRDTLGGQCGTLSKYYEAGNQKNYCYREDISNNDVYFFRLKRVKLEPQQLEEEADVEVEVPMVPNYTEGYFKNNADKSSNQRAVIDAINTMRAENYLNNQSPVSNYFNPRYPNYPRQ